MALTPLTAQQVLDTYPRAVDEPYGLLLHAGGLARVAGESAWLHAVPAPDGSWLVTGRLGVLGDTGGEVLHVAVLDGPGQVWAQLSAAAPETRPEDPALAIVSALTEAAGVTRLQADYRPLLLRFPDLRLDEAGGACPFQAEGTLFGIPFYFRFRHNWASLRLGADVFDKPLYSAGAEFGTHEDQGTLTDGEFMDLMSVLIPALERAPICWEFPGVEKVRPLDLTGDGAVVETGAEIIRPHVYRSWGKTPAEAWAAMHEPSAWLRDEHGVSFETQADWVAARQMVNETLTVDDRVFPDPEPDFAHAARN